jgi:hypothetical protein
LRPCPTGTTTLFRRCQSNLSKIYSEALKSAFKSFLINYLFVNSILDLTEYTTNSSSTNVVSMQSLRLLINLSTNEHMIQYLTSAKVSGENKFLGGGKTFLN